MLTDSLSDPRAHLQRRVMVFSRLACVFFVGLAALDYAGGAEGESLFSSTRVAALVMVFTSAVIWDATGRGQRSYVAVRTLELLFMTAAIGVYATLPLFPPIEGHGGVLTMFSPIPMAVVVLLRSAVIPSPPWLSVLVGLVWGVVMTTANVLGWEGITLNFSASVIADPEAKFIDPWVIPLALGVLTTLAFSFVAGVMSDVVHGLQNRVRNAMQLGQYTLLQKLGEGGMGVVYRARHQLLRRPTAVKLLPADRAGADAVARFEREVQRTAELTHPNTVTVFDYGHTHDGTFYYAMELLEGANLRQVVETGGPMPPRRALRVAAQVAGSLREAHGLGLIHRDIKPENVMLCAQGGELDVAKVLDFGLVKSTRGEDPGVTKAGLVGTPRYLSPEALTDPENADGQADVYALGAVLYYLLVGADVFEGKTMMEVCAHHLNTPPRPPSTRAPQAIPADVEALVLASLEKDPAQRPTIAAFATAAEACLAALPRWTDAEARTWWTGAGAGLRADLDQTSDLVRALTVALEADRG